jgi:hypothetical protein
VRILVGFVYANSLLKTWVHRCIDINYDFEMINVTAGYENKSVIKNINLKISRGLL